MASLHRLSLAAILAALCGGCSFDAMTYTIDRYGGIQATQISFGCPVPFEVYDRGPSKTLLVVTHPFNEAGCSGAPNLTPGQRQREVALTYLHETTDRPLCRIVSETPVSERHTEFTYTCPADTPTPAVAARPANQPLFGRRTVNKRQSY